MIWICPSPTGHPQSRIPSVGVCFQTERHPQTSSNSMEMWKMLTQKFKAQSLDEVQPFQPAEVEDKDSGTESDEENAELQAIEEAMQCQRDQENQPMLVSSGVGHLGYNVTQSPVFQTPTISSSNPASSVSKRSQQLVNQASIPFQPLDNTGFNQHYINRHGRDSPQENSDYERCSLDYEPTSSVEFERPSSEEELTIINCMNREVHSEKRKWSQVNRCNSCNDSSGSSDEEVRDLLGQPKPLNFSSSPPKGVQRLSQSTLSPKLFLANLSPNNVRLCSVSPRKRHRQMSDVTDTATVIQRPCLDFEKMQKTLFRKHIPHGITKARIVKIRLGLLKGTM